VDRRALAGQVATGLLRAGLDHLGFGVRSIVVWATWSYIAGFNRGSDRAGRMSR
jgi:hypothetical protein